MCGRVAIKLTWRQIRAFHLGLRLPDDELEPNYNLAPTAPTPVIHADDDGPLATTMRWWLIPHWAKKICNKFSMFNPRSETAATSDAFSTPFKLRRCVIPVSGFFEWKKINDKTKHPYYIFRADGDPLFFAGLWNPGRGDLPDSFTILTTKPNAEMTELHHRMPCILEPESMSDWIVHGLEDPASVQPLLKPAADGILETYRVASRAGTKNNQDPTLIDRLVEPSSN